MAFQNVVAATLRMRNTAVRTARDLKHEVRDTGREAQRMGTKFGHAIKASRTSVSGLMGSFVSLKTIIAATFAYRAIQRFGTFLKSLTTLYKEQEDATRILGESLAGWNNYSKEMVQQLTEQAMAMQYVINVDNEEIESMMALLASYGMTGEKIKEVIGLTIDFAKAKRIELKAAVDLVGKAFVGYTGTLSRYGIILEKNLTREEKWTATLDAISAFAGLAAGVTETYSGQVGVLTKAYDDMKKQMGAVIVAGIQQSGVLDLLGVGVENVTNWLIKWEPLLSNLAAGGMKKFTNALIEMEGVAAEGNLVRWLFTIGNTITITTRAFMVWFRVVGDGLNNLTDFIRQAVIGWSAFFTTIIKGSEAARKALYVYIDGLLNFREIIRNPWKHTKDTFADMKRVTQQDLAEITAAWDDWSLAADKTFEDAWRRRRISRMKNEETIERIKKDFADLKLIWSAESGKDFMKNLGERLKTANEALRLNKEAQEAANEALGRGIKNRGRLNEQIAETIKLTENMARQYALASRVEQAQIKFLLERADELVPEDILGLGKIEKKLIASQSILKERYKELMSIFTAEKLGIELEDKKVFERFDEEQALKVRMEIPPELKQEYSVDVFLNILNLETIEKSFPEIPLRPEEPAVLSNANVLLGLNTSMLLLLEQQTSEKEKQSSLFDEEILKQERLNRLVEEGTRISERKTESTLVVPNAVPDISLYEKQRRSTPFLEQEAESEIKIGVKVDLTERAAELIQVIETDKKSIQKHNFERVR